MDETLKIRNTPIIRFLKEYDPDFRIKDNVIYAEKAFVVNSILLWCEKALKKKKLNKKQLGVHYQYLKKYLKGEVDMFWQNGEIAVRLIVPMKEKE